MTDPTPEPRPDPRSPAEILKAQKMMVIIFAVATSVPSLWMLLMASSGIALGQEDAGFAQILTYWGLARRWCGWRPTAWRFSKSAMATAKGRNTFP